MDRYRRTHDDWDQPAKSADSVTPSDSAEFSQPCKALFIGGAGNVTVDMVNDGTNITFVGIPAGMILPIRVTRVYNTGTTATSIVRLY